MSILQLDSERSSLKVGHLLITAVRQSTLPLSTEEQALMCHRMLVALAIFLDSCNTPKLARSPLPTLRISAFLRLKKRRYTKMSQTEIINYIEQMLKQKMLPMFLSPRRIELDFSRDFRYIVGFLLKYSATCYQFVAANPTMLQNFAYHYLKSRYMIPV